MARWMRRCSPRGMVFSIVAFWRCLASWWVFSSTTTKGYDWRRALPAGYGLSFLGSLIFAAGGVGDILWHSLFGIERSIEALYSPTHLTLAVGSALIMSGPLRAAWRRPDGASSFTWRHQLPMLLSLTFMLSGFTFSAQVLHPLVGLRAATARPGTDE